MFHTRFRQLLMLVRAGDRSVAADGGSGVLLGAFGRPRAVPRQDLWRRACIAAMIFLSFKHAWR
jgi:hypothetical protein